MKKFAIHVSEVSGHTFVKDYDYFVSQGGLKQSWGKHWKIIEAKDLDDARVIAIKQPGAISGLHCEKCGKDRYSCYGKH